MRSVKVCDDTANKILAFQLMFAKNYKIRVTKGKLIRYALSALTQSINEKMKVKDDGSE